MVMPGWMAKVPRKLSLVRFAGDAVSAMRKLPFRRDRAYVFLGEIPNMHGHCVVAEQDSGRIYAGYHTDHFRELTEEAT